MNSIIFLVVVSATIIFTNLIAFIGKGKNTLTSYIAYPNSCSTIRITLTMLGTIVGGGMFLAVGQIGYEAGVSGYVLGIASLVGLITTGFLSSKLRSIMDQENINNLLDLLEVRYSKRVALLFSWVSALMYFFLLAGQFVALYSFATFASSILKLSWVPWALIGLGGVSMFLYPVIGGLKKDIITDIAQMIIVLSATGYLVFLLVSSPVSSRMWETLPVDRLSGMGYGISFLIGSLLFMPGLFLVRMDVWQRIRAARNNRVIIKSLIISGIFTFVFYIVFTTLGMWAYAAGISDASKATLGIIGKLVTNPIAYGLIIGGFFAAVLSSADTFINNSTIFVTRLVESKAWGTKTNNKGVEDHMLVSLRLVSLILISLAGLLSWITPNIVDLLVGAFSLLLIFLPMILGTFITSIRNESAAFYSALIGVVTFLFLFWLWNPKLAFIPCIFLSFIIYALVMKIAPQENK